MLYALPAALVLGLFSSLHCVGMCGGIMGALTMGLSPEVRDDRRRLLLYVAGYNLGRIASYALIGALVGGLGGGLFALLDPERGLVVLRALAALMVGAVGLYLAGWFPRFAVVERLGAPLWRRLEPLGRRLFPITRASSAIIFGMIWGWLPCGMVYSALLVAAGQGGALPGGLFMLVFGLGTLPAVAGAGAATGLMTRLRRIPHLNRVLGLLLVVLALGGFWYSTNHPNPLGT
ncbi:sulfite exporter TauE/SafE family protein [Thiohalorhabdus methylotrophus]|uniref:Sulfite exporter TauE/SafE family protein n=1 Tax=Thiohalorhabdus methylotrophus TaxID=3242694 RepID=A0ABV4TT44_9GAMM